VLECVVDLREAFAKVEIPAAQNGKFSSENSIEKWEICAAGMGSLSEKLQWRTIEILIPRRRLYEI
jgi:hypothetical protein